MISEHIGQAIVEARKLALETYISAERTRLETYAEFLQAILTRVEQLESRCKSEKQAAVVTTK